MTMNRRHFLKGLTAAGIITPVVAERLLAEPEPIEPPATALGKTRSLIEHLASKPPIPDITSLMISDGRVERWYPIVELSVTSELLDVTSVGDDFPAYIMGPGPMTLLITVNGTVDLEIGETYKLAVHVSDLHARCDRAILTSIDTEFSVNANVQTHLTLRPFGAFTIDDE